jgi:hypothetical protein
MFSTTQLVHQQFVAVAAAMLQHASFTSFIRFSFRPTGSQVDASARKRQTSALKPVQTASVPLFSVWLVPFVGDVNVVVMTVPRHRFHPSARMVRNETGALLDQYYFDALLARHIKTGIGYTVRRIVSLALIISPEQVAQPAS